MPVSPYFNHVSDAGQQGLVEDLIQEAIEQRGVNTHYIRRQEGGDRVTVFNEHTESSFTTGVPVEMYIEEVTNFNGEGDLFSSFGGFTMEDTITFKVSGKRFREELGATAEPEAGDIIYLDFADMAFEVQKKLEDEDYRQWGKNYTFRIKCTKFVYEGEDMNTGVEELDELENLLLGEDPVDNTIQQVEVPQDKRDEIVEDQIPNQITEFGD